MFNSLFNFIKPKVSIYEDCKKQNLIPLNRFQPTNTPKYYQQERETYPEIDDDSDNIIRALAEERNRYLQSKRIDTMGSIMPDFIYETPRHKETINILKKYSESNPKTSAPKITEKPLPNEHYAGEVYRNVQDRVDDLLEKAYAARDEGDAQLTNEYFSRANELDFKFQRGSNEHGELYKQLRKEKNSFDSKNIRDKLSELLPINYQYDIISQDSLTNAASSINETSKTFKTRYSDRDIEEIDDAVFAFNPIQSKSLSAGKIENELKAIGIKSRIHAGRFLMHYKGNTHINDDDIALLSDGTAVIRNRIEANPKEAVGRVLYRVASNCDAGERFKEAVSGNINPDSVAFKAYCRDNELNPDNGDFVSQFAERVSGELYAGKNEDIIVRLFDSTDEVKDAFEELTEKVKSGEYRADTLEPGEMTFDQTGQDYLKYIEVINTYAKNKGYLVFNDTDELIGIRPHNVGDGSITVGIGHYIQNNEWDHYSKKYGITKGMSNAQLQSIYIPIVDCITTFNEDVEQNVKSIKSFIKKYNISLSQNEFNALVIYRYNKGKLNQSIRDMLMDNNRNRSDWEKIFFGGNTNERFKSSQDNRRMWELQIFFDNNPNPIGFEPLYNIKYKE